MASVGRLEVMASSPAWPVFAPSHVCRSTPSGVTAPAAIFLGKQAGAFHGCHCRHRAAHPPMIWFFAMGFALYFFAFRAAADAWASRRRDPGGKPARCGLHGHEVARRLLDANNVLNVAVVKARGSDTAHYDPRKHRVMLGSVAYEDKSLAAMALAAIAVAEACTPEADRANLANRRFVTRFLHPVLGLVLALGCVAVVFRPVAWKLLASGWILGGVILMFGHAFTLGGEYKLVVRAMGMLQQARLLERQEEEDCDILRKGLPLRDVRGLGSAIGRIATALLPFKGW